MLKKENPIEIKLTLITLTFILIKIKLPKGRAQRGRDFKKKEF
jgi:hypothetical protein